MKTGLVILSSVVLTGISLVALFKMNKNYNSKLADLNSKFDGLSKTVDEIAGRKTLIQG